jgi:hypothetical protein
MSKCLWEVIIKNNEITGKNKYPIIYENKTYIYCKIYGTDKLRQFEVNRLDKLIGTAWSESLFMISRTKSFDEMAHDASEHLKDIQEKKIQKLQHDIKMHQQQLELTKMKLRTLMGEKLSIKDLAKCVNN